MPKPLLFVTTVVTLLLTSSGMAGPGVAASAPIPGNDVPDAYRTTEQYIEEMVSTAGETYRWYWIYDNGVYDFDFEDPTNGCFGGVQDAYAESWADGAEIQGYSWAFDECTGSISAATATYDGSNVLHVFLVGLHDEQEPPLAHTGQIAIDASPNFIARVNLIANDGETHAAGAMRITPSRITSAFCEAKGGLQRTTSATGGQSSVTVLGQSVSLSHYSGEGTQKQIFSKAPLTGRGAEDINSETVVFECGADLHAFADGFLSDAECESNIYQSKVEFQIVCTTGDGASLELHYGRSGGGGWAP